MHFTNLDNVKIELNVDAVKIYAKVLRINRSLGSTVATRRLLYDN